jgi:electron transport complex protein RnfC
MRLYRFHGGLPLPGMKGDLPSLPIRDCPLPPLLVLPLYERGPLETEVEIGQRVRRYQRLARPQGPGSAALHAPAGGVVEAIESCGLTQSPGEVAPALLLRVDDDRIEDDRSEGYARLPAWPDWKQCEPESLRQRLAEAGIAGLGGAAFATADKLLQPCPTLILNGAECEPWIACDARLLVEEAEAVLRGGQLLAHVLSAERVWVAVEDSMQPARLALAAALELIEDSRFELVVVPTVYPQGGERQLMEVLTGMQVPRGRLPQQLGIVVQNVGTALAAWRAVTQGLPLTDRIVSVTGPGVGEPGNFRVPLGTPIEHLIAQAGGYSARAERLIAGGGMMGVALPDDGFAITKSTNCVLVLDADSVRAPREPMPCIRCGECSDVCPAQLMPQLLHHALRSEDKEQVEAAARIGLLDCIDCGLCDLVCPSHIPLVSEFRDGKTRLQIQRLRALESSAAQARFEARESRLAREKAELAERRARAGARATSAAVAAALAKAKAARGGGGDRE